MLCVRAWCEAHGVRIVEQQRRRNFGDHDARHTHRHATLLDAIETHGLRGTREPKRHRSDAALRMAQDQGKVIAEHPLIEAPLSVALSLDVQQVVFADAGC